MFGKRTGFMFGKRFIFWLLVIGMVVVPLIFGDNAIADSGAHKSGGGGSTPVKAPTR